MNVEPVDRWEQNKNTNGSSRNPFLEKTAVVIRRDSVYKRISVNPLKQKRSNKDFERGEYFGPCSREVWKHSTLYRASSRNFHKILRTQASIIKDVVGGDANYKDILRMIQRQKILLNTNLKTNSSQ